jgi:hypothetical protein
LVCSGAVLTVGMVCLVYPALRRPAPLLAVAGTAVLAAAAVPDVAAVAAVAAVPGVLLLVMAWALQRFSGENSSRWTIPTAPTPAASSLTRAAAPSLIIAGSAARGDSATAPGRSSS